MKRFDLYENERNPDELEAVKQGFSWPAFFFGWIWAFVKRMPLVGAVLLAIDVGFAVGERVLPDEGLAADLAFLAWLAVGVVCGAYGNAWRRGALERRGFELAETVSAESPDQALAEPAPGPLAARQPDA
jgi:hypothetical protein